VPNLLNAQFLNTQTLKKNKLIEMRVPERAVSALILSDASLNESNSI
jgi:hypothetical protein